MNTNSTNTHNTRGASRKALRLTSAEFDEQLELVAASGLLVPEDERIFQQELQSIAKEGFPPGGVSTPNVVENNVVQNYCSLCFTPLGPTNPRQLCRKTYCENAEFLFDFCSDS